METESKPVAILHIEALEEIKKLKEDLIEERLKQFFWFYQIAEEIIPFGNEYPVPSVILAKAGAKISVSLKDFTEQYFQPATFAIRKMLLTKSEFLTESESGEGGEWDWPYCSWTFQNESVRHSIQGLRKIVK